MPQACRTVLENAMPGQKKRAQITLFVIPACLLVVFAWLGRTIREGVSTPHQISAGEARQSFCRVLGREWPARAEVVKYFDDHTGFTGDGEFAIVVRTTPEDMAALLGSSPLGPDCQWQPGPVRFREAFALSVGRPEGPRLASTEELTALFSRNDVFYLAKSRGPKNMEWHSGTFVLAAPKENTVWLSAWDH